VTTLLLRSWRTLVHAVSQSTLFSNAVADMEENDHFLFSPPTTWMPSAGSRALLLKKRRPPRPEPEDDFETQAVRVRYQYRREGHYLHPSVLTSKQTGLLYIGLFILLMAAWAFVWIPRLQDMWRI
jgi:hypothetical protein